jgi:hypothetical protein
MHCVAHFHCIHDTFYTDRFAFVKIEAMQLTPGDYF